MKCMFDTNVYISHIRDRSHSTELQRKGTVKYLSAIVLMELWAGSKTKKAKKPISQL
jgi:predicted nucleic acid-binding protein